jgi:hypothetical protein
MKVPMRLAALLAAYAAACAVAAAPNAADTTSVSDAAASSSTATTDTASATKPAKLTPAGRAALRVSRKAQMLPGPSFERLGGPLLAAEEAYANRAYPGVDIPIAFTLNAEAADKKVKGKGAGKAKGKDKPGKWELIGPSEANFPAVLAFSGADYTTSGRVTAMAIAPGCSDDKGKGKGKGKDKLGKCYVWVAAAGGGVWRTDKPFDKDPKWEFLSDDFATNAIGALTYDAANGVLYAGTGEPNASGDSEAGLGIYRSTDSGKKWTKLASMVTALTTPGNGTYTGDAFAGRSISSIVVAPNGDLYVGSARGVRGVSSVTNGATSNPPLARPPFGLFKSTDGGATFAFKWDGNASIRGVNHVEMDPGTSTTIYAAAFQQGVWRSTDGGATFSQIKTALVPGANTDRAEFAVTQLPNGKTRMYVGDGNTGGAVATQAHFYRTDDAAAAVPVFTDLTTTQNINYCTGQCWYDNFVYTPPGYPDIVYLGGSFDYGQFGAVSNGRGVLLSQDAGATFTDQTWDATSPDTPNGIHPDQHAIVTHPDNPLQFIEGSDGGLMRSSGVLTNQSAQCAARGLAGASLTLCQQLLSAIPTKLDGINKGLSTLQFQSLSVNPADHKHLMGGTQDNGTFETTKDKKEWPQIMYGDGGQSGFNASNGALRFNTFTGQANDVNFQNGDPTKWVIASAPIISSPEGAAFYPPIIADPNAAAAGTIFQGSQSVWRTQDWGGDQAYLEANCPEFTTSAAQPGCGDFVRIGPAGATDLTLGSLGDRAGGVLAALARTPSDTGTLWAATQTGRLFISKNADAAAGSVTFTRLDSLAPNDPNRFISGIAVDPSNPNRAYVSYSGYDFNTPAQPGHVFLVTYNPVGPSATWTDLTYDLGDLPATGIAFDDASGDVYASSDFGVNLLQAGKTTWVMAGEDLPQVEVAGLTIVPGKALYAATHGRSAWKLKLD